MSDSVRSDPIRALPVLALTVVLVGGLAWAGASGHSASASYQIPRQTVDAGAGRSSSASFTLNASIGQPDVGARMTSASFRLSGGFHRGAPSEHEDRIFADRFQAP